MKYVETSYPIPDGKFGTAESQKILLEMYPDAVRHGRTPGGWKFKGGRAVTTCRRLVVWSRPSA